MSVSRLLTCLQGDILRTTGLELKEISFDQEMTERIVNLLHNEIMNENLECRGRHYLVSKDDFKFNGLTIKRFKKMESEFLELKKKIIELENEVLTRSEDNDFYIGLNDDYRKVIEQQRTLIDYMLDTIKALKDLQ